MSDALADDVIAPAPKRRWFKAISTLLVLAGLGGLGFFLTWSQIILPHSEGAETAEAAPAPLPEIAFVELDPIVISLPPGARSRHLKFTAQLEVVKAYTADVELLKPRIVDVLNSYLRAIDLAQIEDPGALARMRGQMVRRVQIVTGEGRVRDLLIGEFVLD